MKIYITFITITLLLYLPAITQIPVNFKMVNAHIGSGGELVIKASATSSKEDFNFLAGNWIMENKRLKSRLSNSTEWVAYHSTSQNMGIILNGLGNLDFFRTEYNQVNDQPYEGITLRLFNPVTRLWSLYWADSNLGVLDPPVVGSFEGNIGTFYCRDTWQGKPILVMFQWDKTDPENPVWAQAFSADEGKTWEMNLTNVSHRVGTRDDW
ncbi:MAG: hypothetical protein ACTHMC_27930 [Pseudobacter sp.]|uniref:hypothetical protein n=1 Tax=Pseudobacter sp. TaxID=2045420 RepID=UPI003F81BEF8